MQSMFVNYVGLDFLCMSSFLEMGSLSAAMMIWGSSSRGGMTWNLPFPSLQMLTINHLFSEPPYPYNPHPTLIF